MDKAKRHSIVDVDNNGGKAKRYPMWMLMVKAKTRGYVDLESFLCPCSPLLWANQIVYPEQHSEQSANSI